MADIGQGVLAKPLQKPHPPIVVTAGGALLQGRHGGGSARLGADLGQFPDAAVGQEPLGEVRRGLPEGRPAREA